MKNQYHINIGFKKMKKYGGLITSHKKGVFDIDINPTSSQLDMIRFLFHEFAHFCFYIINDLIVKGDDSKVEVRTTYKKSLKDEEDTCIDVGSLAKKRFKKFFNK